MGCSCAGLCTVSRSCTRDQRPVGQAGAKLRKRSHMSAEAGICARGRSERARTFCPADPQLQCSCSAPRITPSHRHLRAHWSHPCSNSARPSTATRSFSMFRVSISSMCIATPCFMAVRGWARTSPTWLAASSLMHVTWSGRKRVHAGVSNEGCTAGVRAASMGAGGDAGGSAPDTEALAGVKPPEPRTRKPCSRPQEQPPLLTLSEQALWVR